MSVKSLERDGKKREAKADRKTVRKRAKMEMKRVERKADREPAKVEWKWPSERESELAGKSRARDG